MVVRCVVSLDQGVSKSVQARRQHTLPRNSPELIYQGVGGPSGNTSVTTIIPCQPLKSDCDCVRGHLRDHAQITTTKVAALRLGNGAVSVPRSVERTRPGSLAHLKAKEEAKLEIEKL